MTQINVMSVLIELIDQSEREKKTFKKSVTSLYTVCFLPLCFLSRGRLDKQVTKQTNHALLVASQY